MDLRILATLARMASVDVVRTYLELTSRAQLSVCENPDPRARVERVVASPASFFRYLYQEVGRAHSWLARLAWSDDELRARMDEP